MHSGIQKIFSEVSDTYELVNHALTFGLDILWRRKASAMAASAGGNRWIDICSGTGETAANLQRLADKGTQIIAADFSPQMLCEARKKPEAQHIDFVITDVSELPFPDDVFDLATISFATRNINTSHDKLIQRFSEINRILKPGGRFVNVETSQPSSRLLRAGFHFYVKTVVGPLGHAISGSRAGYDYLSHTIPRFYDATELADILGTAGFSSVSFKRLMFGVGAIHVAVK
ncbi:ubiquinone/menaquinone biosynthesis methyltransferase [Candidatus Latescibacterota bacterium]